MNAQQLVEIVTLFGVHRSSYRLPGEAVWEGWNAAGDGQGGFVVFFQERGTRTVERHCASETDALKLLAYCLIDEKMLPERRS